MSHDMEIGSSSDQQMDCILNIYNELNTELGSLPPPSSKCCIHRVPKRLRHVNEKAYTPQVISIGPLHHGRKDLKAMEDQKKRYLKDFILRTDVKLKSYIEVVSKNEEKLRSCYADTIEFTGEEFVKIILVDAAFIIEVLLRTYELVKNHKDDERDELNRILQDVWPDMQLLENQLPFFILEDLFDLRDKDKVSSDLSITILSHQFLKALLNFDEDTEVNLKNQTKEKPTEHFVDLIRKLHLPLSSKVKAGKLKTLTTPSMIELRLAGVRFKVSSSRNLFDIKFCSRNGILKIPKLIISGETDLTFRNLLAFEQCYCKDNWLNDYVVMMDRLVNIPKDVDLLVKYGIVENWLGDSAEASTLINKLADGASVDVDHFSFASLSDDLNKYCKTPWRKWMATLRQNYFVTRGYISFIFVLILLQTVYIVAYKSK